MLRIMPRQKIFFDGFEECAKAGVQAAALLREMLDAPGEFARYVCEIQTVEQRGDRAITSVVETLATNLATPFERSEIRALIEALDDIIDACETIAQKLVMYRAQRVRPEARELARILAAVTCATEKAVVALRTSRAVEGILGPCREVRKLETEADKVLRRALGTLFGELSDPIELIKWKEILEILEHATDRCQDVSRIIEEIVRQHD